MSNQLTLSEIVERGVKLTPMMEQYYSVKKNYPDVLVFFRMGDFYELFFEDAREVSKVLNISLTHRGKLDDIPIPMAGIPHHAASAYIDRITAIGKKVVICEQLEDPSQAKGIVKRGVTQIVSPGIPYDLDRTQSHENKFLAAASFSKHISLVFIDFTTGDFFGFNLKNLEEMMEKIHLYRPKEFITHLGQWDQFPAFDQQLSQLSILKTNLSSELFQHEFTSINIEKLIKNYKRDKRIADDGLLNAIGALSFYICSTQSLEVISHIAPFKLMDTLNEIKVSPSTLIGLEIMPKSRELQSESILGFMDKTLSAMGGRKIKQIFQTPLKSKKMIEERLKMVQGLKDQSDDLNSLREEIRELKDIERIMAKLTAKKITNGDLLNLAHALGTYKKLQASFQHILCLNSHDVKMLMELKSTIEKTINDEIGAHVEKGNAIKAGAHKDRDKLAKLSQNSSSHLVELEAKYRKTTGIGNLKIKYNNISGYFIEVSKSHTSKVPKTFTRTQTLVNNERYETKELAEFEKEILTAQDRLHKLEKEIFQSVCQSVSDHAQTIIQLSSELAYLDVIQSFAYVANLNHLTKPILNTEKILKVKKGWHPLIKSVIKDQFVEHDLNLDQNKFFALITGPNMAGKTTVMREMAIIQFLAQIGSFVPAQIAELSVCDLIFSRLGASDDIMKGQSTFMVEMSETAEIIRHATADSLILLDEIGRGTSTYDGLSIAWSLVEYLVKKTKAITLFSTHYHELIELVDSLPCAGNFTVKTINEGGKVQFLYRLVEGGAHQSFGIHVAELAGLPKEILKRSSEILQTLEKNHNHAQDILKDKQTELPLFQAGSSAWEEELKSIDLMNLTPIEAMNKLHELKQKFVH